MISLLFKKNKKTYTRLYTFTLNSQIKNQFQRKKISVLFKKRKVSILSCIKKINKIKNQETKLTHKPDSKERQVYYLKERSKYIVFYFLFKNNKEITYFISKKKKY